MQLTGIRVQQALHVAVLAGMVYLAQEDLVARAAPMPQGFAAMTGLSSILTLGLTAVTGAHDIADQGKVSIIRDAYDTAQARTQLSKQVDEERQDANDMDSIARAALKSNLIDLGKMAPREAILLTPEEYAKARKRALERKANAGKKKKCKGKKCKKAKGKGKGKGKSKSRKAPPQQSDDSQQAAQVPDQSDDSTSQPDQQQAMSPQADPSQ